MATQTMPLIRAMMVQLPISTIQERSIILTPTTLGYISKDPVTNTMNALWFLQPVLWAQQTPLYLGINWQQLGELRAATLRDFDIDVTGLIVNYTSIHSTGNAYTNAQGFSSFYVYGPDNYLFTLAPGSFQFDMTVPYPPTLPLLRPLALLTSIPRR